MTYWVLNTIRQLRSFVQQLGGEILHFLILEFFLMFVWIKDYFTWNFHLSSDLNSEQRITQHLFNL